MIPQPTIVGVCIGLIVIVIYLIVNFSRKQTPSFNKAAKIIMSCVGMVTSLDFGIIALISPPDYLGNFKDYRIPMFLGALAVIWTAIEFLYQTFSE